MMKKITATILTGLLLTGCTSATEPKFDGRVTPITDDVKTTLTFEYGDTIDLSKYAIVLERGTGPLKYTEVKSDVIGEHEISLTSMFDEKEIKFTVTINDTKAPVFAGLTSVTITEGESLDLSEVVTAADPVDGDVEVTFSDYDLTVGTHTVTAKAVDKHGNEATQEITIIVEEKAQVPTYVPPVSNGGSSSNGGTSNGGSSSNGGNTSNGDNGSSNGGYVEPPSSESTYVDMNQSIGAGVTVILHDKSLNSYVFQLNDGSTVSGIVGTSQFIVMGRTPTQEEMSVMYAFLN